MSMMVGLDDVYVRYCATTSLPPSAIGAAIRMLPDEERARCDRFVFERDRRDFAVAHALLRRTLSSLYPIAPRDWTFVADANGKPMLTPDLAAAAQLSFNLAHTDGLVACAVARTQVGVDVETLDHCADPLDVARRFFSAAEFRELDRCDSDTRQQRFVEIWTLKEAYLKATGKGLSSPLSDFTFAFERSSSLRFDLAGGTDAAWSFELFVPSERHRMAVAARATGSTRLRIVACPGDPEQPAAFADAIRCVRSYSPTSG